MLSKISQAVREERRERFEEGLKQTDRTEYRDYLAEKKHAPDDRRNEVTGY